MRTRNRVLAAVGLLALAAAWWAFAPTAVGGRATYVVTHGTSMLPRYEDSDLVVVLPTDTHRIGDVAAYRSPLLDTTVLHRIVERDGENFVFKGDNNSWVDPEQPDAEHIIGRPWVHIRNGGQVLAWLHTPTIAAPLASGLVLAGVSRQRRRRRRQARAERAPMRMIPAPSVNNGVLAALAAILLLATGTAVAALLTPTSASVTTQVPWTEQVDLDYRADVPRSAVYPDGQVNTGEPVFRRLVDRLELEARWALTTQATRDLRGTGQLIGTLSSPAGWTRTLDLGPVNTFAGDQVTMTGTLDLAELDKITERLTALTGVAADTYSLDLRADMNLQGRLAGQPLGDTGYGPTVTLSLTPTTVLPTTAEGAPDSSADLGSALSGTAAHTVSSTRAQSADWPVLGQQVPITTIRTVSLVGAGLAAGILLLLLLGRPRNHDDPRRIAAQYGRSIVEVTTVVVADGRTTIDVAGIHALARIAQRYDRLILHQRSPLDTYLVEDEATVYRYQPRQCQGPRGEARRLGSEHASRASGETA